MVFPSPRLPNNLHITPNNPIIPNNVTPPVLPQVVSRPTPNSPLNPIQPVAPLSHPQPHGPRRSNRERLKPQRLDL